MAIDNDSPQEQAEIYYDGTPGFKPRTIRSSKVIGTSGAPPIIEADTPAPPPRVAVATAKAEFVQLQDKFDTVGQLLDARGQGMTICQNLPPAIRSRYLRQKREGESCWAFYKRMVDLANEFPGIDPNNLTTYAEQLATHGNDILDDPFDSGTIPDPFNDNTGDFSNSGGQQRVNNFNEDPGKNTLLLMLFIAILRLITSAVFNIVFPPLQSMVGKLKELKDTKEDKAAGLAGIIGAITGVISAIGNALDAALTAIMNAFGPIVGGIVSSIFFEVAKNLALDFVESVIAKGPKLRRDVERYDSLIISSYTREISRYSEEQDWPEAAMIYPQYRALNNQFAASTDIFGYFEQSALSTTRQGANFVGGVATNAAHMPLDLVGVLTLQKDYIGSSLDRMSRLLGGRFTDNLFCCLFRFLGAQDLRWLRTAQAILRLSMNRQAIVFESLDSALANLWHTIEKVILSAILGILYNLFDEINSGIKSSLTLQTQNPLFTAGTCLSWNQFVQNMLQFIGGIELSILNLVVDFNHSIQSQDKYNTEYMDGLDKNQYAKRLLKLIDIIINALQFGDLCKTSGVPSDEELRTLFDQVKDQFGNPSATVTGTDNLTLTGSMRGQFDECLGKVPQEKVAEVIAWIKNLTGQNNG